MSRIGLAITAGDLEAAVAFSRSSCGRSRPYTVLSHSDVLTPGRQDLTTEGTR